MTVTLRIPADPRLYLKDRCVFIMGAGRTGTTVLGQLIGSMEPVFFLFEPVLLRVMLPLLRKPRPLLEQACLSTLFEDYMMPKVQGRKIDPNDADKTCWTKYTTHESLWWRNKLLRTRTDAMYWLQDVRPVWLIKLPELQPMAPTLKRLFPGCVLIHTIRNGKETVQSCVKNNWYGDEWMKDKAVEWTKGTRGCPWYMPKNVFLKWQWWNPETRAAAVWRITTTIGMKFESCRVRLESLQQHPANIANEFRELLNLRSTHLTEERIKKIKEFTAITNSKRYDDPTEKIAEPERSKFLTFNKELGYESI